MDKISTSITLYGKVYETSEIWSQFLKFSKEFFEELGIKPNYIDVKSDSLKGNKILKFPKNENKVLNVLANGENLHYFTIYSLPDNFNSVLDYQVNMSLHKSRIPNNIILSIPKTLYDKLHPDRIEEIIQTMKKFIDFTDGEIFEMNLRDNPYFYSLNINEPTDYPSLKIVKKL